MLYGFCEGCYGRFYISVGLLKVTAMFSGGEW